jgi:hypothetical protein
MDIEIFVLISLVLLVTACVRKTYERRLQRKSAGAALNRFQRLECVKQRQVTLTFAC